MTYLARLKRRAVDESFTHRPELELTKLPKAPSVSSVSTGQGPIEKIPTPLTADNEVTIRAWLAHIGEADPAILADVLNRCRADPSALAYYQGRALETRRPGSADNRMAKTLAKLHGDPTLRRAVEAHDDLEPDVVVLTVAIQGQAACELRIPKSRYDAFALAELIEKHTTRATLQ